MASVGKVFSSVGHFFASIAHGVVNAAKKVDAVAPVVAADAAKVEAVVDPVIGALLPQYQPLERLAFEVFGNAIAEVDAVKDAGKAVLQIEGALFAQLKAVAGQAKTLASAVGVAKPTDVPTTAPAQ